MINENDLLEPRKAYETILKEEHRKHAEEYFDRLVAASGVDENANRETVEQYNDYIRQSSQAGEIRAKKKKLEGFLVAMGIVLIVIAVVMFIIFAPNQENFDPWMFPVLGIVVPIILIAGGITFFVMNGIKVAPIIRNQESMIARLNAAANEQKNIGYQQLQPLNQQYTWNMHVDIVNETVPLFKLDKFFDFNRLQYLGEKFGYKHNLTNDMSLVHVQSGEILGNPFVIETVKVMCMDQETYEGTLTITYRVKVPNGGEKGGYHYETRTQTLHAFITKPKPFYNYEKFLYYGNEAAPDLNFSRIPSGINTMSDQDVKKYINKQEKELDKYVENKSNSQFTALANKQFETLFHAWDRDNEVQFRLLFTPLAQKNYLDLIKNKSPYGDDFMLKKTGKLNKVRTEHSQYVDYVCAPGEYNDFSIDEAKAKFVKKNEDYFRSFYFDMATLMSIPLYQQYPTDDYIFNKVSKANNTIFEEEAIANSFPYETFKPKECATELILKAAYKKSEGEADRVGVTSFGYKTIEHLDYVPVMGKDGHLHEVPVRWIEYKPVTAQKEIEVIRQHLTRPELLKRKKLSSYNRFVSENVLNGNIIYDKEFFAFLTNEQREFNKDSFKGLLSNEEE